MGCLQGEETILLLQDESPPIYDKEKMGPLPLLNRDIESWFPSPAKSTGTIFRVVMHFLIAISSFPMYQKNP